jgi:hypothetical protein
MGLRPAEIRENPFERHREVGPMGIGAAVRVFPVRQGGFSALPRLQAKQADYRSA